METIYTVLRNEVYDGEDWSESHGSFRSVEDAKAKLKEIRDVVYFDWENETIDQDDENGFYAFRDGWYDQWHINLYIMKMQLWDKGELK